MTPARCPCIQGRQGRYPVPPLSKLRKSPKQACAVPWKNFLCCGMLRHASTCTCGCLRICGKLNSQTRDNMHNTVGPNSSLSPSGSSVVGLLTYIIAKCRKVFLPICKPSFVWMWPIKLNVRSTWQAERGRRTKKTASATQRRKIVFFGIPPCHSGCSRIRQRARGWKSNILHPLRLWRIGYVFTQLRISHHFFGLQQFRVEIINCCLSLASPFDSLCMQIIHLARHHCGCLVQNLALSSSLWSWTCTQQFCPPGGNLPRMTSACALLMSCCWRR